MLLATDIKTTVKYAERRIMWITPNEAKRLGVRYMKWHYRICLNV